MVYVIKATGELPLPSTLTARPSKNIVMVHSTPGRKSVTQILFIQEIIQEIDQI